MTVRLVRGPKTNSKSAPKRHNSALSVKVELRQWLGDMLGGSPRILDCFAAKGMLWDRAYGRPGPERYVGCDLEQVDDERAIIVCDSRRYIRHADVDLARFDLFDLDAYGSPLEHLALICHRLRVVRGRRVGFVITDGTGMCAGLNALPHGLLNYVGVARHQRSRVQFDHRDHIIGMAVAKAMTTARLRVIESRIAKNDKTGPAMRYGALLAEGT